MTSSLFFNITTAAYFIAMVIFIVYLTSKNKTVSFVAVLVCWVGFLANTVAIGLRWREAYAMGFQQAPLSHLYESVVFFAWSILLVFLIFDLKYKQRAIGAFVIPFAFAGMIWAQWGLDATIQPLVPALQSNWLTYHVITCFIGYAAFAVACGV
ncbi:MAG: cytochrome c biogenesis protein CcsA, partial [Deltaproteobacteria bacterium]|nr:cytochrome c biogenesis protein CcsA [Deltaproteobacteria bacterium]